MKVRWGDTIIEVEEWKEYYPCHGKSFYIRKGEGEGTFEMRVDNAAYQQQISDTTVWILKQDENGIWEKDMKESDMVKSIGNVRWEYEVVKTEVTLYDKGKIKEHKKYCEKR